MQTFQEWFCTLLLHIPQVSTIAKKVLATFIDLLNEKIHSLSFAFYLGIRHDFISDELDIIWNYLFNDKLEKFIWWEEETKFHQLALSKNHTILQETILLYNFVYMTSLRMSYKMMSWNYRTARLVALANKSNFITLCHNSSWNHPISHLEMVQNEWCLLVTPPNFRVCA